MRIIIPDGTKEITQALVTDCLKRQHNTYNRSKITSVTIPDGVTSIRNSAFSYQ